MDKIASLTKEMINYETGVPRRVHHFLKVHNFAKTIAILEGLSEKEVFLIETAALVHDIGIKPALEKYKSQAGKYQEELGGAVAAEMLGALGFEQDIIKRVCYLVEHHHTYDNIDGIDYQILIEADFLVNIYEGDESAEATISIRDKIFKTKTGTLFLNEMFLAE